MPSDKKSHKKLLLSVIIAGTIPGANAADGWDCVQTDAGWSCAAAAVANTITSEPDSIPRAAPAQSAEAIQAAATTAVAPARTPPPAPKPLEQLQPKSAVDTENHANDRAAKSIRPSSAVASSPKQGSASVSLTSTSETSPSYMNLDWVQLSPLDTVGKVCKGAYVEPDLWRGPIDRDDETIVIDADSSSTQQGGTTALRGNVLVRQPGRQVEADAVDIDSVNRQAFLQGDVRYREPGFLFRANAASLDLEKDIAIASESQFVMHDSELRGSGLAMTRYPDRSIETQNATVTYCEPGNDDWAISAKELVLHPQEGYGESWHTRFEVLGVPVFYLPYFYFPLDDTRISGFLYPSLSQDEINGFDLAAPYYFNIAPNIDDTLTARLIQNRGLMLENEARYLNSFSMNQLSTGWMPSDDIYNSERWALNFDHKGNPAPGWSTSIDYTRVSDDDYFTDLTPVELRLPVQDDLNQSASLSYSAPSWTATALVHDYQTIDGGAEPYARMPQLTLSGAESLSGIRLGYLGQYTEFQHDTSTDGQRIHLRPSLSYDWSRTWGYLRPELGLWNSSYDLSDGTSPSATANFASLDSGLIFERQGEIATQTLEPRVKLIHVGGDDTNSLLNATSGEPEFFDAAALGFSADNLFDTLGYSGNDRVAHTDQATIGLTSRIYSLTGREVVNVGVAQAHYFKDHDARPGDSSGTEDMSDYAIGASWKPSDALKLSHTSRIDKDDGTLLAQNYGLLYNPDAGKLLYSSFRQTKSAPSNVTLEQIDLAAKWPLSPAWSLVGRYTEDLQASENLETLLGVEYGSCCWKVRFTGQRTVVDGNSNFERDNTFYLQFVLKGLGTLGGADGREFLKDLTGFDEDANENF